MNFSQLPVPPNFNPDTVGEVWRVRYQQIADAATQWAAEYRVPPAHGDRFRLCVVAVDIQNTFCIPGFELFVAGRSGSGAVGDNRRLCEFIYRNLACISGFIPTLDTHQAVQIFHAIFLIDENGRHPPPFTQVTVEDLTEGRWRFNPAVAEPLDISVEYAQRHIEYYASQLRESGKYELTIWPYHAMLGGIGHALVSAVEEAIFFHTIARHSQPAMHIKGNHPLTEHYSVLGPEVGRGPDGGLLVTRSDRIFEALTRYDAVVIAGQAKSHCVAWTIADLLQDVMSRDGDLARKIYLLEDCTSPVVVPGVMDFTEQADAAFHRFAEAGMHVVRSTEPLDAWPDLGDRG